MARDDLFRNRRVAYVQSVFFPRARSQHDHVADEFMARDDGGLAVSPAVFVSPEERCAEIAFEIAGTDPRGSDADDDLLRSRKRHGALFEAVVLGSVGRQPPASYPEVR